MHKGKEERKLTLVASVSAAAAASWKHVSHGHCLLGESRTVTSAAVASTTAALGVVVATTTAAESAAAAAAGALAVVG